MDDSDRSTATRRYWIRVGYTHATAPRDGDDESLAITYQPDVYAIAFALARTLSARRIIDVGCGDARKLVAGHPEFDLIGIDVRAKVDRCRTTYGFGRWLEHDLDSVAALPIGAEEAPRAIVVCSDVIEHVPHPERLLENLAAQLAAGALALVISTPERELTRGILDTGPPRNHAHLREWSIREFDAWLAQHRLAHRSTGLTRSNDRTSALATILTVATREAADLEPCRGVLIDYLPECTPNVHRLPERLRRAARMLFTGR